MKTDGALRPGSPEDAEAAAAIVNDWIDARSWMPRVHAKGDVVAFYRDFVFRQREVWVLGDPVEGFMALAQEGGCVTALYVANPGQGLGKRLLGHAKTGRHRLELWTFQANRAARRFYAREGFREVRETDGDNEEGLPDVLLRWDRWPIRKAGPEDAGTCARIVHDWVRHTPWIEDLYGRDALTNMIADAMPMRDIFLIGDPPEGYLSLNPGTALIGAFYLDRPGQGMGKALLDHVKEGRDYLHLWTHEPNRAAQRFYAREGFRPVERNPKGDDGLPEIRMEWRKDAAHRQ